MNKQSGLVWEEGYLNVIYTLASNRLRFVQIAQSLKQNSVKLYFSRDIFGDEVDFVCLFEIYLLVKWPMYVQDIHLRY